jgi:hypothetical protein
MQFSRSVRGHFFFVGIALGVPHFFAFSPGRTPSVDAGPKVSRRWATEPGPRSGRPSSVASDASRTSPTVFQPAAVTAFRILVRGLMLGFRKRRDISAGVLECDELATSAGARYQQRGQSFSRRVYRSAGKALGARDQLCLFRESLRARFWSSRRRKTRWLCVRRKHVHPRRDRGTICRRSRCGKSRAVGRGMSASAGNN